MVHLIAISVALVCLSGSSVSYNLVRLEEEDYRWNADPSMNSDENTSSNSKKRHDVAPVSLENNDDYNDSVYDHENGNQYEHLNNQEHKAYENRHKFVYDHVYHSRKYHDYDYNDDGGNSGHNSQTGYWRHCRYGSHGHKGVNPTQPGHWKHYEKHNEASYYGHQDYADSNTMNGSPRGLPRINLNQPHSSSSGADRVVFPDFDNRINTTSTPQPTLTTASLPKPTRTTTERNLLNQVLCIRQCPTTSEYNPVCGTNNITYNNPGALQCASDCGVNVAVAGQAPCPRVVPQFSQSNEMRSRANQTTRALTNQTTPTPNTRQTTKRPRPALSTVRPTRYTNVASYLSDSTLVPLHILEMVFGNAHPTKSVNEEPEFDMIERINI